jgi:hypothetical protein
VLGLGVAGVDLIRSDRGPLVLEVNASPGLEGIESASKKDIAGEIDGVAAVFEEVAQVGGDIGVVLDDKDSHGGFLGLEPAGSRNRRGRGLGGTGIMGAHVHRSIVSDGCSCTVFTSDPPRPKKCPDASARAKSVTPITAARRGATPG